MPAICLTWSSSSGLSATAAPAPAIRTTRTTIAFARPDIPRLPRRPFAQTSEQNMPAAFSTMQRPQIGRLQAAQKAFARMSVCCQQGLPIDFVLGTGAGSGAASGAGASSGGGSSEGGGGSCAPIPDPGRSSQTEEAAAGAGSAAAPSASAAEATGTPSRNARTQDSEQKVPSRSSWTHIRQMALSQALQVARASDSG
jgi:hypothetical protein